MVSALAQSGEPTCGRVGKRSSARRVKAAVEPRLETQCREHPAAVRVGELAVAEPVLGRVREALGFVAPDSAMFSLAPTIEAHGLVPLCTRESSGHEPGRD